MNQHENLINNLIEQINWEFIAHSLKAYTLYGSKNTSDIIIVEKERLATRLKLMQQIALEKLYCEHWIISQNIDKSISTSSFKIYFTPYSCELNLDVNNLELNSPAYPKNSEWTTLHTLLHQLSEKEEFEKCSLIKKRLMQLIEEMET